MNENISIQVDAKKSDDGSSVYFTLPSNSREQQRLSSQSGLNKVQSISAGSLTLNVADTLQISTMVCSTKLTHNGMAFTHFCCSES